MTKTTSLGLSNKREDYIDLSAIRGDIRDIVNQQVLEALEKLKSKKLEWSVQDAEMLEHQDKSDFIAVPLSAIEQLEKEYRK